MKVNVNVAAALASLGCLSLMDDERASKCLKEQFQSFKKGFDKDVEFNFEPAEESTLEAIKGRIFGIIQGVQQKVGSTQNICILEASVHSGLKVKILNPSDMGIPNEYLGSSGILEPHVGALMQVRPDGSERPYVVTQFDLICKNIAVVPEEQVCLTVSK